MSAHVLDLPRACCSPEELPGNLVGRSLLEAGVCLWGMNALSGRCIDGPGLSRPCEDIHFIRTKSPINEYQIHFPGV